MRSSQGFWGKKESWPFTFGEQGLLSDTLRDQGNIAIILGTRDYDLEKILI